MNRRRLLLLLVLLPVAVPLLAPSKDPEPARVIFKGQVIALADASEKFGATLDRDAAPYWLALETKEGRLYPLFKDPGSRMFFKDKNLLKKPVELTGRVWKESSMLQVLSVRTVRAGKLHEPHYWCDICKIKRFEPNACDCCGAPLEFREEPVTK